MSENVVLERGRDAKVWVDHYRRVKIDGNGKIAGEDPRFGRHVLPAALRDAIRLKQIKTHARTVSYNHRPDVNDSVAITVVKIFHRQDMETPIAVGYAFCSPKERDFVKRVGHNVALGRALRSAEQNGYTIVERTKVAEGVEDE